MTALVSRHVRWPALLALLLSLAGVVAGALVEPAAYAELGLAPRTVAWVRLAAKLVALACPVLLAFLKPLVRDDPAHAETR